MNPNSQKQPNRPALGKGLASLLPGASSSPAAKAKQLLGDLPPAAASQAQATPPPPPVDPVSQGRERIPGITLADLDQIIANQFQPRRDFNDASLAELAESIRANGVIQPLITRRGEDGKLHLIAGERRLRAAKLAGIRQVPVVIRKSSDKEALELALIENIQREDLNCVDVALSYFQLSEDFQLTQEEIAKRVGKDRVSVANHLRLLKLPESIIQDLRESKLSFGHGRALLSVTDPLRRMEIRNQVVEKQLSVRETERLVAEALMQDGLQKERRRKKDEDLPAEVRVFAEKLGRALGTRVKTKGDQYRGSIVIDYFSKEDLERISEQLLR
jgi:ParB family transcriptional regulator, chromosome partitioning protein